MERLAEKHPQIPSDSLSWHKGVVGGSDDHGGLFIARAHTCSRVGESLDEFISAIHGRLTWAAGHDGGPLTMAHSLYGIAHSFYRERFGERRRNSTPFVSALLDRFFNLGNDKDTLLEKYGCLC